MPPDARPAPVRLAAALAALPLLPLQAALLAAMIVLEEAKGWPDRMRGIVGR